ncbi:hypothetical protein CPB86DRAFT_778385, partial [Serendipita vermifera]
VFAQRYPRYLIRLFNKHEEFYALLMLIVERHYLKKHAASFAENFYGMNRRRRPLIETTRADIAVGQTTQQRPLKEVDIRRSLIFLVGLPYFRAKAQDYYESLGGGLSSEITGEQRGAPTNNLTRKQRLQKLYKRVYPIANIAYELWIAGYNIAYLFDKTPYYRPWLAWMGIDLRRASPAQQAALSKTYNSIRERIKDYIKRSPYLLLESLKIFLPLSIFFVKFLEWWYSPSSPARALSTAPTGPAIPPPQMLFPHPRGLPVDPSRYGECPICHEPITNATLLPTGYAFCYKCIHPQIEEKGVCPVTLHPVAIWQLRKIMV